MASHGGSCIRGRRRHDVSPAFLAEHVWEHDMKLAVSSYSLSRWMREKNKSLEDVVAWLADHGVAAIEFAGLDEAAAKDPIGRAKQLRELCEKRGLGICGYCVGAELLAPPAQQQATIRDIKGHIDVAV